MTKASLSSKSRQTKLIVSSYAKLNLFLEVTGLRRDGYHNIKTVFERISLKDTISLALRSDSSINLDSSSPFLPRDNTNIAWKAAELMRLRFGITQGMDIYIHKNIPVGAGLGGGSSNAAAVIAALNRLWNLGLGLGELCEIGASLGADVPFFLHDTPFAYASIRGDRVRPIEALRETMLWHVLVLPKVFVSTKIIYKRWDEINNLALTSCRSGVKILTSEISNKRLAEAARHTYNGLEKATFELYPEVGRVKGRLKSLGADFVLMSGSGSAVFALVASPYMARKLVGQLKKENSKWQVCIVSTA